RRKPESKCAESERYGARRPAPAPSLQLRVLWRILSSFSDVAHFAAGGGGVNRGRVLTLAILVDRLLAARRIGTFLGARLDQVFRIDDGCGEIFLCRAAEIPVGPVVDLRRRSEEARRIRRAEIFRPFAARSDLRFDTGIGQPQRAEVAA